MTIATATSNVLMSQATAQDLESLRTRVSGEVITAHSATYHEARKVQDMTVDSRPLAIVRAVNASDIAETVRFARRHALPLGVRSGGHSLARYGMVDDTIVADLSGMKQISIDPVTRVARVQAGATSGDLAGPANEHGLALSTGDTATVGLGGLATGGGIGFMVRKHGLTIDSLLSAQVVTAAGDILTASENENTDLFWAIRGGGGNFGIITEFTLRLAAVGDILGGDLLLPASRDIVRGYLDYSASAPEGLSTIANLMYAPPAPFVPEEWVGKLVLGIIVCWTGPVEEGERAVAPLRALANPVADTVRPMSYPDIYLSTAHQEARHGFALRSMFADELSDDALDAMLESMQGATSPYSIVHLRGLGGAMARVDPGSTAFAHRDSRYLVAIIGIWLDAQEDGDPHRGWVDALWRNVRREGSGVYVNFLEREGEERLRDAYPAATLAKLTEIKRKYDPDNLFRLNQNVRPRP